MFCWDSQTTLEVFVALEHTGFICPTDLTFLKKIIQKVCPMLTEQITEYETKCSKSLNINLLPFILT